MGYRKVPLTAVLRRTSKHNDWTYWPTARAYDVVGEPVPEEIRVRDEAFTPRPK